MNDVCFKKAIVLCIGSKNWSFPKTFFIDGYDGTDYNEYISDIIARVFERCKELYPLDDIYIVSSNYYGKVTVLS